MMRLRNLTRQEEIEILNEKKSGVKRKDILIKWGISERHYKELLLTNGETLRKKIKSYKFDENYFEKIDTEDKAYFLGFLVADGCISKKDNSINLTQKETEILYEFKMYIKSESPIYTSKTRNISNISVSSLKTKQDLFRLGVISNKTKVVKYPAIPEHLQNHFMRGVFDGDGCISLRTDKRDNQQRGQFNICSGSLDFIQEYYTRLVKYCNLSGKNKIRCPRGTYYVVDWGGLSDIENIYIFLYKNANVFIRRKKETFDRIVNITKNKKKYRKCAQR